MLRFRSFQGRLTFFILGLVSLVQVVVFLTVDVINTRHAREHIDTALEEGVLAFRRVVDAKSEQLTESVRILAGDFAFKSAIATGDVPTIESVLQNHGQRVGADIMQLIGMNHAPVADSRPARPKGGIAVPAAVLALVRAAERNGRSGGTVAIEGAPYQMLVQPVLAPLPIGWIAAGFRIDDRLARDLKQFTKLEISFAVRGTGGNDAVIASSLPESEQASLAAALKSSAPAQGQTVSLQLHGEEYLSRAVTLGEGVNVVLQRSLQKELQPFQELRVAVMLLSCGGLLLSAYGAFVVARSVTRPVRALAHAARSAEQGNYAQTVELRQQDELGELAGAFNRMMRGLAERDQVRNLLGKVVSPAVAEKLLSRDVVLGGEEREVTVLFSDLRGFTTFSEKHSAQETVAVLNAYFTHMSSAIESNGGGVDKYIGDGIMALFGAPVAYEDDAGNAIAAALAMRQALRQLNDELCARSLPRLDMGIGINTAVVVAGNLGSPNRLNYTVIGDGVNLASRLEGLTKRLPDVHIIVAEATLQRAKRRFRVKPLGASAVRGRTELVNTFAVLSTDAAEPARPQAPAPPLRAG